MFISSYHVANDEAPEILMLDAKSSEEMNVYWPLLGTVNIEIGSGGLHMRH